MARWFFPQGTVLEWVAQGLCELGDGQLRFREPERRYSLAEALHVEREVSGGGDLDRIVGRVMELDALRALGAAVLGSSVVFDDRAYEGVPGFVAVELGPEAAQDQPPSSRSDAAELARYLVDLIE